ncbi:MAG: AAA family ATPase [Nitrosopumilus sp.]|nr:AAA family ATPase [Nitrosopumilus sp.]
MGLGWGKLGDLNNYKSKEEIVRKLQTLENTEGSKKNDATANYEFKDEMSINDVVIVKTGRKELLGYGIVKSAYYFDNSRGNYKHCRKVEWKKKGSWKSESSLALKTLTDISEYHFELDDDFYYQRLLDIMGVNISGENLSKTSYNNFLAVDLNTILFGPPGTGKTYNTVNKALSIVNPEFNQNQLREIIKTEFDRLMQNGQIIFTTFHQSMGYEDFIEGIKPIEPKEEDQHVNYKIVDGIFKKVCSIAAYNCYKLFIKSKAQIENYSFDDLYDAFISVIQRQIDNKLAPIYKTLRGRDVEIKEINSNDSIIARAQNSIAKSSAPLTKENMQKLYDKFKTIEEIKDLSQVRETVQVTPRLTEFYAVFAGLKQFEKSFKPDEQQIKETNEVEVFDFDEIQKKFNAGVYNEAIKKFGTDAPNVVLIIDEINRGNVSQIFGELITLIEEDKRIGNTEEIKVKLPYSKSDFGVPSNLYIIGTMNTADRSVEALDTALRRRFNFVEMQPRYDLTELDTEIVGIKLSDILKTINNRIEKLLNKDHQIGHSYLMNINKLNELKFVFKNKILPLLQEYFFGDFGKIGLVLGSGFFEDNNTDNSSGYNLFASFHDYDSSDFIDKPVYRFRELQNMTDEEFEKALNLLMNR